MNTPQAQAAAHATSKVKAPEGAGWKSWDYVCTQKRESFLAGWSAALRESEEVVELKWIAEHCKEGNYQGYPDLAVQLRLLGEQFGFGALMMEASHQWKLSAEQAGYPTGGEFSVGPCVTTVKSALQAYESAVGGEGAE